MLDSEAIRIDAGSPRWSTSSKWRSTIRRRMPRRRWVGSTEIQVRPPTGIVVRPGRVSSSEYAPPVATSSPSSTAVIPRSNSNEALARARRSSVMESPKTSSATRLNASHSSGWTPRIVMSLSMTLVRRCPRSTAADEARIAREALGDDDRDDGEAEHDQHDHVDLGKLLPEAHGAEDPQRKGVLGAGGEGGHDHLVEGEREGEQGAGHERGGDDRKRHVPEGLPAVGAEVHGRLHE